MALTMIRTLLGQSLTWAEGGHIPAWLPVRDSAAYRKLKPAVELLSRSPTTWSTTRRLVQRLRVGHGELRGRRHRDR